MGTLLISKIREEYPDRMMLVRPLPFAVLSSLGVQLLPHCTRSYNHLSLVTDARLMRNIVCADLLSGALSQGV